MTNEAMENTEEDVKMGEELLKTVRFAYDRVMDIQHRSWAPGGEGQP